MSGYVLESGSNVEQSRYLELQRRLQTIGHDRRVRGLPRATIRRENVDLCESQIMDMFWDAAPIFGGAIHEQMRFFGHQPKTSQRALKRLRDKGILCLLGRSYHLLDADSDPEPLEVGSPIVFLPGTRSQKTGHIVELKELKQGVGGTHPIALLDSGQTMFVSPETARVDLSQKTLEDCLIWLLRILSNAVSRETAVDSAFICRKAYEQGIPQVSNLIKVAINQRRITKGYKRFATYAECIYWQNQPSNGN